jgi:hypothetical protein
MRSIAKLYPSSRVFQRYVARYLHTKESRQFLTFNGLESNWPSPSFGHNLCFRYPNGSCELTLNIYIPKDFQWYKKFFNPWILTPTIAFWRFGSPLGLQLPKWEFTWECEGSFPHTLLHSHEYEMWFLGSLLARTFASPYFGREPKAKVTTKWYTKMLLLPLSWFSQMGIQGCLLINTGKLS